jgi:iron complex outermembrane receptor protein
MLKVMMTRSALIAFACSLSFAAHAYAVDPKPITVPAGDLTLALESLAKQAHVELVYQTEELKGMHTNGVSGNLSPQEAVTKLLEGTSLTVRTDSSGAMLIAGPLPSGPAPITQSTTDENQSTQQPRAKPTGDTGDSKKGFWDRFRVAQLDQGTSGESSSVRKQDDQESKNKKPAQLEEVVVTGTHIHGVADSASPVSVYTRDDIDQAGVGSVAAFVALLPQNFGGGASLSADGNITGGGNAENSVSGTGVNFRGLGNDATLVLINGHRIAPGNVEGNFVDLSLIPLAAVDRIETVTDGASALYGSDAIGGVMNIILKSNFQGAETRVRYGSVADGGSHDSQVGQTVGHDWGSGSALLSYEYDDSTPLYASARSYTQSAAEPLTLLPEMVRQGVYASIDQTVRSDLTLYADGMYTHRSSYFDQSCCATQLYFSYRDPSQINEYSGTFGAKLALPNKSHFEISSTYGASDTHLQLFQTATATPLNLQNAHSTVLTVDPTLDGSFELLAPAPIGYAIGGQFRHESFDFNDPLNGVSDLNLSRNVTAGFIEVRVPVVGPVSTSPWGNRLEVSLAGRYEHYSNFGSTTNPQLGVIWKPLAAAKFRATYGKSFEAPNLYDLNPLPSEVVPYPVPDPNTGKITNTLFVYGGNPALSPEAARTWTAGFDLRPLLFSNLALHATYYNITFNDRIASPGDSISAFSALDYAAVLGPALIQRNPPLSLVRQLASLPTFTPGIYGIDLASIGAIADFRYQNLSSVKTSGIDFDASYIYPTRIGQLEAGLDSTYILKFQTQFANGFPPLSVLNTPYNPVDLRLRARGIVRSGPMSISLFVNYTNSYTDNRTPPSVPVASWTTADVTATYTTGKNYGVWSDLSVQLSVINLANRKPPFVTTPFYEVNYDGANANALGRFLSVQVSKRF